ncbi:MAG: ThuA domain-containing protein [Gemmatimonadota bacterium]
MISMKPTTIIKLSLPRVFLLMACLLAGICLAPSEALFAQEGEQWITYEPAEGPGNGKHIVLISGDEEYRSEEALPMLGKILARRYGFKATVLFAIDPETGEIDPDIQTNIPGLHTLQTADLMVIFTRFRELPDEQMTYIVEYINAGKPVVGLRTATHAFRYERNPDSPYAHYAFNSAGRAWADGFGRQILGETWIDHHGAHGREGTRGVVDGVMKRQNHAILRGVEDIWGPSDVYGTRQLAGDAQVLVWGLSTEGMTPDSPVQWEQTAMPVAWIKHYTSGEGNTGRVFTSTMGASVDLESEDLRRLVINGCFWAIGMDRQIPEETNVDYVGEYHPTMFGFDNYRRGLVPSHFAIQ